MRVISALLFKHPYCTQCHIVYKLPYAAKMYINGDFWRIQAGAEKFFKEYFIEEFSTLLRGKEAV